MTTDGATMLGGLTHLFATNPALLLIIPAVLFIFCLVLRTRHRLTASELAYNLKRGIGRWQDALEKVQDQRILNQPDVITHSLDEYDDSSRVKYEEALMTWATWKSQREVLTLRLAEAEQLQNRVKNASWWKFPLGKLKRSSKALLDGPVLYSLGAEPANEQPMGIFLPALQHSADKARQEADFFANAFNVAAINVTQLNQAVDGTRDIRSSGLVGQKGKLIALDLPFEPYKARMDAILTARDQLTLKVTRQPLGQNTQAVTNLLGLITKLEKDLAFACKMHATGLSTAASLEQLAQQIAELRSTAVPSQVPGTDIHGSWSLDEEGYAPDPIVDEAVRQSAEFSLALKAGDLTTLDKLDRSIRDAIGQTNRLLESTMAEKTCFEMKFAEITADCTEVDLVSDAQSRQGCLDLYVAQKWVQARTSCEAFFSAHARRLSARAESRRLESRMAEVTRLVSDNVDVSSAGCDAEFKQLVETTDLLNDEAKQGATEWDALRARIVTVINTNSAGGVEAFLSRLCVEIDAYAAARSAVEKLDSDLRYTDEKTRDKWGGASARTTLESVTASVQATIASALPKKQDWDALTERVKAAAMLLEPALQAVQEEVRRDRLEYDRLATLSGDIELCNAAGYTRTVSGKVYGRGIYCPTVIPTQKLAAAREHYQGRRYDAMAAALMAGRQVLITMHLDAWWLCLETLAFSADTAARQYAQAEGYDSFGYDEWMEVHKKRSLQGALFNISEIPGDTAQGQPFAEEAIGDAPVISDYTPGALVSNSDAKTRSRSASYG